MWKSYCFWTRSLENLSVPRAENFQQTVLLVDTHPTPTILQLKILLWEAFSYHLVVLYLSYGMIGLDLICYFYLLGKCKYVISIVILEPVRSRISNEKISTPPKDINVCNMGKRSVWFLKDGHRSQFVVSLIKLIITVYLTLLQGCCFFYPSEW